MANILLIESDIVLANTYGQALRRAGHDVMWCITAHQGILGADDTTPDLVIVEPQLAEHGGIEFLYEFRSYPEWDDIPVVVFSRLPVDEVALTRASMDDLGIVAFWHKSRYSLARFVHDTEALLKTQGQPQISGQVIGMTFGTAESAPGS